ncbi:TPA: UvrD-helicase domain-containing protein [Clostridium perfringens]|uniref:UvrD-helicase domain-containing protein n=1 Tax=Clostridium perfringens TaxID=1502 RepID=UPI001CCD5220|nr:UvrD-helicase domain-containing protein [Clostridium perfringens]EJT5912895.1 UvrD-helicase domain-containing protein [Clostridium perfringens]MDK0883898.1 3'-5' exonuclease [Clostridium perfringens]MDK0935825.1 3'-5' exonuclease [Clostridium perfringens]MDK0939572.1 3'-5' exonuclease [Clostridium perfringens]MDM0956052.1 3'-5' exonuclease [Clostridium perfringens]
MGLNNESKEFFKGISRIWRNYKDYTYLDGIKLSQAQIDIIEKEEDQLLIEGYAGTGKSLTLIYKFINVLVREEGKRVLYVTFNGTLIEDTKKRLSYCNEYNENKERHHVEICTFHEIASNILKKKKIIDRGIEKLTAKKIEDYKGVALRRIAGILSRYIEGGKYYSELPKEEKLYKTHDENFIREEVAWIKAMGFIEKEKYFEKDRIGRSKSIRLTRSQRKTIFKIFEEYCEEQEKKFYRYLDLEDYALKLIQNIDNFDDLKFDYIFVDEVQDLDPMQIKALCLLTNTSIVLSGDANQRIYKKSPVKYEELGLRIKEKGKRKILNKNYRSTGEIVKLANSIKFFDESINKYNEKQFVKSGDRPIIRKVNDKKGAVKFLIGEIKKIHEEDPYKTIAIIHREKNELIGFQKSDFRKYLEGQLYMEKFSDIKSFESKFDLREKNQVFYTNGYDVKGLEFDVVFIINFNTANYPLSKELKKIKDENDGKEMTLIKDDVLEFINREKRLLYVAMTRAKEKLYLVADCKNSNISSFIYDFNTKYYEAQNFKKKEIEENYNRYKINMEREYGIIIEDDDSNNVKNNDTKQENKFNTESKEKGKDDIDKIKVFFINKGIEVVDNRDKSGCLWIVAGKEAIPLMKKFGVLGYNFIFIANGGRASKNRPAWYLKNS